nr:hypothetical protein [Tanacetum cinerariifolium]
MAEIVTNRMMDMKRDNLCGIRLRGHFLSHCVRVTLTKDRVTFHSYILINNCNSYRAMQNLRSSMSRALDTFIVDAFESREAALDSHSNSCKQKRIETLHAMYGDNDDCSCPELFGLLSVLIKACQQFATKVDPFLSKEAVELGRLNGDNRNSDVCVNILDRIC